MSTSGGVPSFAYPTLSLATGDAFEALPGAALTTTVLVDQTVSLQPFYLPGSMSLAGLAVAVTAAGQSGSVLRLGLYADDGSASPGDLAVDAGTVAGDAVAIAEATLADPLALAPGWYWTACVPQSAGTTVPTVESYAAQGGSWALLGALAPDPGYLTTVTRSVSGLAVANITGALPATLPAALVTGRLPRVLLVAA